MSRIEITSGEWFDLKDLFEEMAYFIYEFNPGLEAEEGEGYDSQGSNLRWLNFLEDKLINIHNFIVNTMVRQKDDLYWARYEMQYFNDFERKLHVLERVLTELYPDRKNILWGVNGVKSRFRQYDICEWYSKPFEDFLGPLFSLRQEILNDRVIICNQETTEDRLKVV